MNHSRGPVRTCVGCRGRDSRSTLVRLVADSSTSDPSVVVDPKASSPGRGAWVHPHPDCLDRAITRRAIVRALRIPVLAEHGKVVEWFDRFVRREPLIIEQESGSEADGHPMSTLR
ncbi:YlxR family protein [Ruania alkalisoli]|uniref:YlxR family protein n=1 Tax=Ruania alkalisoli TaxID=2779775 RepID=A0A7M1SX70_9MICO|nr:YlxR family protein [Ruania alkalisoli]QOR72091.1 YlxR family protein [Ruania alkalisoli]